MENKFAPIPLLIDLEKDPEKALAKVKRVSKEMKDSFGKTYAIYFLSIITSFLLPTFILKLGAENITLPFTTAFSNTPGILRPLHYKEVTTLAMIVSILCTGRLAMAITIISYAEKIQFCIITDTCIKEHPKDIREKLDEALEEMIEIGKTKP